MIPTYNIYTYHFIAKKLRILVEPKKKKRERETKKTEASRFASPT